MRWCLVFLLAIGLVLDHVLSLEEDEEEEESTTTSKPNIAPHQEIWFEQRLDHLNPRDGRTWKQRYWINDKYHKDGGPVFFQLGGEFNINDEPNWVSIGQMAANYAKRYNALNVYLEHRFFGKSRPTKDLSIANLKYLSTEQSLRDAAYFVEQLNKNMSLSDSKWIVFGGSYPGTLSAWFRTKYPHLVDGSVSSSAPLMAELNNSGFFEAIGQNLNRKCYKAFKTASDQLKTMFKDSDQWPNVKKQFNLCSDFNGNDKGDVDKLGMYLVANQMSVSLLNKVIPGRPTIDDMCAIMTNTSKPPLDRWSQLVGFGMNGSCLEYKPEGNILLNTSWEAHSYDVGARPWQYLMCTEIGAFPTTDSPNQPFGDLVPLDHWLSQCSVAFGLSKQQVSRAVNSARTNYGGRNIRGTKIIYVNGSVDPWHKASVLKSVSDNTTIIFINGTAHIADMFPDFPTDSEELKEARIAISDKLGELLEDQQD